MEHSRIGAIEFDAPAAPFHHLALPLERTALRFGLNMDGRRQHGRNAPDTLTMIEAGAGGTTRWDDVFESACLYFTDAALAFALGREEDQLGHDVRTRVELHAPGLVRMLYALHWDSAAGQPHGTLVGDAIFVALAAQLVPQGEHRRLVTRLGSEPSRVRRALEHIHANLTERLGIAEISVAASTSPFYLNHAFRAALGCSIWQYVLRARARYAMMLMHDRRLTLTEVSQLAGFDTYASFIGATRQEFGDRPSRLRKALVT